MPLHQMGLRPHLAALRVLWAQFLREQYDGGRAKIANPDRATCILVPRIRVARLMRLAAPEYQPARQRIRYEFHVYIDGLRGVRAKREITEDIVKQWLIEHYSDIRKLPRNRIEKLLEIKDEMPFLEPPKLKNIYRGIHNVTEHGLKKLRETKTTDPVVDKSWTTSPETAWKFARGEWTKVPTLEGRYAVVLVGEPKPSKMLLNWKKTSELSEVAGHYNPIWKEPLRQAILDEKEVVVLGPVRIKEVRVEKTPLGKT